MADVTTRLANLSPEQKEALLKKLREQRGQQPSQTTPIIPPIPRIPRNQPLPLSFAQEQLWLEKQLNPDSAAYTIANAVRLSGSLHVKALQRSLHALIQRHEILRTSFPMVGERVIQHIADDLSLPFEQRSLESLSPSEQEDELARLIAHEEQHVFNLEAGPLLRMILVRLGATEHVLLLTMHHIITDKWSMGIFIRELAAFYDAFSHNQPSPLPELPVQYADFAVWQRQCLTQEILDAQLAYWRKQLADIPPLLELPTDRARPMTQAYQGSAETFFISSDIVNSLKMLSQQSGATLFMTLLGAFATLLSRYSRQEDVVIGTVIATRRQTELESLIGFFLNNLVFRVLLGGNPTFQDLLAQMKQVAFDAYAHQDVPFEYIVSALRPKRTLNHHPIVQVMCILENVPFESLHLSGLTLTPIGLESMTADYDLALSMAETPEGMRGKFVYNALLFEEATIRRMCGHFRMLLAGIATNPNQRVQEFPLLTDAERVQMLEEWNPPETTSPAAKCVNVLFEEQAERTPDAIAVVFEGEQLTYHELNRQANQFAHYLQKQGVAPEVLVGIGVERSLEMIVALLGVLKAGGAYLPLDPAYPPERLAFMAQDSRISLLLTQAALRDRFRFEGVSVCCIDTDRHVWENESPENPVSDAALDHLAYVIYTSGSTGTPKGVAVTHTGIPNLCAALISAYQITPDSRILQAASFSFDGAVAEIFTALLAGATLYLATKEHLHPGPPLLQTLRDYAISVFTLPPSALNMLDARNLPNVRTVVSVGEACSAEVIARWQEGRRLINGYGPTETTVCATLNINVDTALPACIGRTIQNVTIYILNPSLQLCPIGVPGELHIGGKGLARGYLNRPELTADKFIANPFACRSGERLYKTGDVAKYLPDGRIEFLGRIDHQVKIRGYRIELGEIEAFLKQHSSVADAAVIARATLSGDTQLLAYVVLLPNQTANAAMLRDRLKTHFPDYMVPAAIILLDQLPLTPNGKLDRHALPLPDSESVTGSEAFAAPRNSLEHTLAEIWREILQLETIGIYDDFFDSGGHSLLTVKLIFRIKEVLQHDLLPKDVFEAPTIAQLAERIHSSERGAKNAKPAIDFSAEIALDPAITPHAGMRNATSRPSVFLTGVTGFVGAFLLYELLHQTESDIWCLVRSASVEQGKQRIRAHLKSYYLWDEQFEPRIFPVIGDLAQPLLGIPAQQFAELGERLTAIYHNGALVNFIYPYAGMKAANVFGTQEVLRLAMKNAALVHYVSTLSVFDSPLFLEKGVIYEHDPLDHVDTLQSGYAQSKWVAEQLIMEAGKRGLPTAIYRLGLISGHHATGACDLSAFSSKMLKGCLQLGSAPDQDVLLDLTPVDYVSKAIVALAQDEASIGHAFHIVNPVLLPWKTFVGWINDFGYPLRLIPYKTWRAELIELASQGRRDNALYPLLPMFMESDESPQTRIPQRFDCQLALQHLERFSIRCPLPDETLLRVYFRYFIQRGFLSPTSVAL